MAFTIMQLPLDNLVSNYLLPGNTYVFYVHSVEHRNLFRQLIGEPIDLYVQKLYGTSINNLPFTTAITVQLLKNYEATSAVSKQSTPASKRPTPLGQAATSKPPSHPIYIQVPPEKMSEALTVFDDLKKKFPDFLTALKKFPTLLDLLKEFPTLVVQLDNVNTFLRTLDLYEKALTSVLTSAVSNVPVQFLSKISTIFTEFSDETASLISKMQSTLTYVRQKIVEFSGASILQLNTAFFTKLQNEIPTLLELLKNFRTLMVKLDHTEYVMSTKFNEVVLKTSYEILINEINPIFEEFNHNVSNLDSVMHKAILCVHDTIAMLSKAPNDSRTIVEIKTQVIQQANKDSDVKFNLLHDCKCGNCYIPPTKEDKVTNQDIFNSLMQTLNELTKTSQTTSDTPDTTTKKMSSDKPSMPKVTIPPPPTYKETSDKPSLYPKVQLSKDLSEQSKQPVLPGWSWKNYNEPDKNGTTMNSSTSSYEHVQDDNTSSVAAPADTTNTFVPPADWSKPSSVAAPADTTNTFVPPADWSKPHRSSDVDTELSKPPTINPNVPLIKQPAYIVDCIRGPYNNNDGDDDDDDDDNDSRDDYYNVVDDDDNVDDYYDDDDNVVDDDDNVDDYYDDDDNVDDNVDDVDKLE